MSQLVVFARRSAERKQTFRVLHHGWARKIVPYETEDVRARLRSLDRTNGFYILKGVPQSSHWSRMYEYPYAAHQFSSVQTGGRILECGCGFTSFQFYLAEQGFEVHSVDCFLPALEAVAARKEQMGLHNLKPTFGNVFKLPFSDSYFDGVSCISVLEHTLPLSDNPELMLRGAINELLRVLRKGALLILTFDVNFGKERRNLTPDEYGKLCDILSIATSTLPEDGLYSSDTSEGRLMGEDLAVYCVTLTKS